MIKEDEDINAGAVLSSSLFQHSIGTRTRARVSSMPQNRKENQDFFDFICLKLDK